MRVLMRSSAFCLAVEGVERLQDFGTIFGDDGRFSFQSAVDLSGLAPFHVLFPSMWSANLNLQLAVLIASLLSAALLFWKTESRIVLGANFYLNIAILLRDPLSIDGGHGLLAIVLLFAFLWRFSKAWAESFLWTMLLFIYWQSASVKMSGDWVFGNALRILADVQVQTTALGVWFFGLPMVSAVVSPLIPILEATLPILAIMRDKEVRNLSRWSALTLAGFHLISGFLLEIYFLAWVLAAIWYAVYLSHKQSDSVHVAADGRRVPRFAVAAFFFLCVQGRLFYRAYTDNFLDLPLVRALQIEKGWALFGISARQRSFGHATIVGIRPDGREINVLDNARPPDAVLFSGFSNRLWALALRKIYSSAGPARLGRSKEDLHRFLCMRGRAQEVNLIEVRVKTYMNEVSNIEVVDRIDCIKVFSVSDSSSP